MQVFFNVPNYVMQKLLNLLIRQEWLWQTLQIQDEEITRKKILKGGEVQVVVMTQRRLIRKARFGLHIFWQLLSPQIKPQNHLQTEPLEQIQPLEHLQESYINGWITKVLPEDWRGELEALRYKWRKEGQPKIWIELKTGVHILDMLKAHFQVKIENAKFFKKDIFGYRKTDL